MRYHSGRDEPVVCRPARRVPLSAHSPSSRRSTRPSRCARTRARAPGRPVGGILVVHDEIDPLVLDQRPRVAPSPRPAGSFSYLSCSGWATSGVFKPSSGWRADRYPEGCPVVYVRTTACSIRCGTDQSRHGSSRREAAGRPRGGRGEKEENGGEETRRSIKESNASWRGAAGGSGREGFADAFILEHVRRGDADAVGALREAGRAHGENVRGAGQRQHGRRQTRIVEYSTQRMDCPCRARRTLNSTLSSSRCRPPADGGADGPRRTGDWTGPA